MRILVAAIAVFMSGAVVAQSNQQEALDQMRRFSPYQQAVKKVYQEYESSLSTHCPQIVLDMVTSRAKVFAPLQLDASGLIVKGGWTEQIEGVACGEKRRYTAVVVFKDGTPSVYASLPGDSYASPVLQHDAMLQLAGAMGAMGASCRSDVLDTRLPAGAPSGAHAAWDEQWTVRSCDKRYRVPMHFAPDETGTGINVKPAEIISLSDKVAQ